MRLLETPTSKVRLDKWLWAARFYKTRSQATEAIAAGHVKTQGNRSKAGQSIGAGVVIEIVKDRLTWEVEVVCVSDKRGSGADAQRLYRETAPSKERREEQLQALRAAPPASTLSGRPTKHNRRAIDRWRTTGGGDG